MRAKRRPDLSQESNLKWASELLEVEYDKGAKDITRVFFSTTGSPEDLVFLDDGVFEIQAADLVLGTDPKINPSAGFRLR